MSTSNLTLRSRHGRTQTDVPQPLQIVKRPDSRWSEKSSSSRRYSSESTDSDTSVRSAPEPPGGDEPLTVPKRRGNNAAAATPRSIPAAITRPRRSTSITDPLETEDGTVVPSDKDDVPPPTPPTATQRKLAGVPAQASTSRRAPGPDRSAANHSGYARLDYSRLRNSKSMLHMTASPYQSYTSITEEPIAPSDSYSSCDSFQGHSAPASPRILVPQIVVTPETKVLDDGVRWANSAQQQTNDYHEHRGSPQSDNFQYGCLYDVSVEVLPTVNSKILEVLDDRASCSRLLIMAHVQLSNPAGLGYRTRGHVRQSSDDLIQDLEHALGTTTTEYLRIRMTYRHSAFPYQAPVPSTPPDDTGIAAASTSDIMSVDTKMETTSRAIIKRYNSASPWSLRPVQLQNPPLFEIIASHWGSASAREIMHRIATRPRPLPPLPQKPSDYRPSSSRSGMSSPSLIIAERISEETVRPPPVPAPPPNRAAPPIPKRQTSLHRASLPQYDGQTSLTQEIPNTSTSALKDYDSEADPAKKIWTQMLRRTSPGGGGDNGARPSFHVSRVKKVPSSATMIPQPTPSSIQREVAVAVRRLPQDEEPAQPVTPSRKIGNTVGGTMRGRGGRMSMGGNGNGGGGDSPASRILRGSTSMANLKGDESGDGQLRRMVGAGRGTTGVGSGIAGGMGLGAGARLMGGVDVGPGSGYYGNNAYGNNGAKGGKKDKDAGKWGWSGWWQS
ncbi:hypothetical protein B0T16DRAFT_392104 [Cercophora newfieldiana]|uniref:Uncharacterized protein n=1 Tax=Cercophora newfieldiana TaxID=92897 RepID=A0AA39Y0A6_9PEZI|nr:hypothetical protein B0T16DRAFT_392104 [Cercophora newfieldiana]